MLEYRKNIVNMGAHLAHELYQDFMGFWIIITEIRRIKYSYDLIDEY